MIKLFLYLPTHIFNMWIAHLSPRWIFRKAYAPSGDTIRKQETITRNKMRKMNYYIKRNILDK